LALELDLLRIQIRRLGLEVCGLYLEVGGLGDQLLLLLDEVHGLLRRSCRLPGQRDRLVDQLGFLCA
jgi:hypothetical protein